MAAPQRSNRPAPARTPDRNTKDGERVLVQMGEDGVVLMTERARKKGNFKAIDPKKGTKGRFLKGHKGGKSITLQFGKIVTVNKKRPTKGRLYQIPVPAKAKIDDYIEIAKEAKADAFITPDGRRYPVAKAAAAAGPRR